MPPEGLDPFARDEYQMPEGKGYVFEDLKHAKPDTEHVKALLASEIIKSLDRDKLTVRAAHVLTGIAAADFSRIRNSDLGRFTVDRLMTIVHKLGSQIEITVIERRDVQRVDPVKKSVST